MYQCILCNYNTSRKSDYQRHLVSAKHLKKCEVKKRFTCETCKKNYAFQSGLSRHQKSHETQAITNKVLIEVLKDNQSLKNELLRQQEQLTALIPHIGNHIHNNFNIQIFLNEKCKNAINMNDFINTIQDIDISRCHNHGLIKNITDTFITALNQLSLYERPIHCSDKKRSTLYIKDNDRWDKDQEYVRIKSAIDNISYKHLVSLKEWINLNPRFNEDQKLSEEYITMSNSMTMDLNKENGKPYKKIINSLSQGLTFDKMDKIEL